jgi:hypothetical protein
VSPRGPESRARIERGDWQTPPRLADAVLARVAAGLLCAPKTVLEPTCGRGAFLLAAAARFPRAALRGFDISAPYTRAARAALAEHGGARVTTASFFDVDWRRVVAEIEGPLLVVGNPPWVTSATLGALGAENLPPKQNTRGLSGLEAVTGKSNFDVSEWMIVRLLEALDGRDATLAMLCKSAVARRVVETIAERSLDVGPVGLWRIDAGAHFEASVSAVLLVARSRRRRSSRPRAPGGERWPVYGGLDHEQVASSVGVIDGVLAADAAGFARTRHLAGDSDPEWRSGVKHDCARVMELSRSGSAWRNGLGERVDIEDELVHPLLKSSDVANDRAGPSRAMIVPQRALGEETASLRRRAPRAWRYLSRHRALLDARKSSIYLRQPPFAVFGVGPYSFAPWKVAVSGLYKRATFTVVGPHEGRPVVLDDTCYFLAFDGEAEARGAARALRSEDARDFLAARVFWDAKRPITKTILQTLDLGALEKAVRSS